MARKFTTRIRGRWSEITAKVKAIFTSIKPGRSLHKKIPSPQATKTYINSGSPMLLHSNAPSDIPSVMYSEVASTQTSHISSPFQEASVCSSTAAVYDASLFTARSTAAMHTEKEHREPSVFENCMYCNDNRDSDYCRGGRDSDTDSWTSQTFSEDSDPGLDMYHHKCWHLQDDPSLVDSNPFITHDEIRNHSPRS
ncbi:hypothetical protein CGRA01v4_01021 [Colletotrichum graminicola]|nr:hypothetical protein CGRA01v4_01021 [Colletotrichum graminicola]